MTSGTGFTFLAVTDHFNFISVLFVVFTVLATAVSLAEPAQWIAFTVRFHTWTFLTIAAGLTLGLFLRGFQSRVKPFLYVIFPLEWTVLCCLVMLSVWFLAWAKTVSNVLRWALWFQVRQAIMIEVGEEELVNPFFRVTQEDQIAVFAVVLELVILHLALQFDLYNYTICRYCS